MERRKKRSNTEISLRMGLPHFLQLEDRRNDEWASSGFVGKESKVEHTDRAGRRNKSVMIKAVKGGMRESGRILFGDYTAQVC